MNRRVVPASFIILALVGMVGLYWNAFSPAQSEVLLQKDTKQVIQEVAGDQKIAKVAPFLKKPMSPGELNRKKLNEAMTDFLIPPNTPLGTVLQDLEKNAGFPRFVINNNAFKTENPDAPNANETPVSLPNVQGIPKSKVIRLLIDQIPTNNAVYLVRSDFIEITTNDFSLPEFQFIEGNYQDVPLDEVLAELSDRSGFTILLDTRVGDKAKTLVSARFRNETNLATAIRLLADMANLKLVIVDRMFYVTTPNNTVVFPPGRLPGPKQRVLESA